MTNYFRGFIVMGRGGGGFDMSHIKFGGQTLYCVPRVKSFLPGSFPAGNMIIRIMSKNIIMKAIGQWILLRSRWLNTNICTYFITLKMK